MGCLRILFFRFKAVPAAASISDVQKETGRISGRTMPQKGKHSKADGVSTVVFSLISSPEIGNVQKTH